MNDNKIGDFGHFWGNFTHETQIKKIGENLKICHFQFVTFRSNFLTTTVWTFLKIHCGALTYICSLPRKHYLLHVGFWNPKKTAWWTSSISNLALWFSDTSFSICICPDTCMRMPHSPPLFGSSAYRQKGRRCVWWPLDRYSRTFLARKVGYFSWRTCGNRLKYGYHSVIYQNVCRIILNSIKVAVHRRNQLRLYPRSSVHRSF